MTIHEGDPPTADMLEALGCSFRCGIRWAPAGPLSVMVATDARGEPVARRAPPDGAWRWLHGHTAKPCFRVKAISQKAG